MVTNMTELADKADSPIPRNTNHKEKILLQGGSDRVCVIDIKGLIARQENAGVCTPKIIALLKQIEKDNSIKALILDMDTPGGEVIASDEINSAIWKLRKARNIPVITCMHSMGASGGYYIASATDYIIANRMTFTGSIGVIMSSVNATELMDKIGLKSTAFTSGDMKDMLSPTRPMTEKELAYTKAMIHETFTEFAKVVAKGREAFKTHEEVMAAEFADGRVLSGAAALDYGLVDELGGFDEAVAKACELAKIENPTIMQLQPKQSLMDILMSANTQVKPLSLDGLLPIKATSLEAGKLYYIAPQAIAQ
ncbi:MAG: signal peptide peptidase SppA [Victivallales bacterium]|nr:signal peptide peptidase SppA [Victivallales bacterium]